METIRIINILDKLRGFEDPQAHDRKRQVASMMFTEGKLTTIKDIAALTGKKEEEVENLWLELKSRIREASGADPDFPITLEQAESILEGIAERELEEELLDKYIQVRPEASDVEICEREGFGFDLCTALRFTAGYKRLIDLDGKTLREVLIQADIPSRSEEEEYEDMRRELISLIDDGERCSLCEYPS